MEGGATLKAKVVTPSPLKIFNSPSPRPTSRSNAENIPSRPASPTKPSLTTKPIIDSSLAFRPKAKVNSSATTRTLLKVAAVKASTSTGSIPRSRSPTNIPPRVRNGVTSPTHTPKPSYGSNSALRYPTVASAPPTPERTASLTTASTTASSSLVPSEDASNSRMGTLHHAVSFSAIHPTPNYSASPKPGTVSMTSSPRLIPLAGLDRDTTSSPTPRIRSKVSTVAKVADFSTGPAPGLSQSSAHPSTRSLNLRTRTPSVSSSLSQQQSQPTSPPFQFYPITTATVAANPHRYVSARPPSRTILPAASQVFQSLAPKVTPAGDGSPPSQTRFGVKVDIRAKVDPNSNSAPPLSPPMSAVSFSSHSSVSRSSASVSAVGDRSGSQSTSTASSHLSPSIATRNGRVDLNATLDSLIYTSGFPSAAESAGDTEDEIEDEERKVKAAAKSNRKIADLEITNRSLLAINATLEATKHRQAKEIRELKRKLRESRLILPPRAYRAVRSSLEPFEIADDEEDAEDDGEEGEDEKDEIYHRISLLIDNLLNTGKRALEKQTNDFLEGAKGGAKVLTAEEVRDWHQGTGSDNDLSDHDHDDLRDEHPDQHETVFERQDDTISMEGDNSLTASEAEVEAMTLTSSSPPIFITKPSQSYLSHS